MTARIGNCENLGAKKQWYIKLFWESKSKILIISQFVDRQGAWIIVSFIFLVIYEGLLAKNASKQLEFSRRFAPIIFFHFNINISKIIPARKCINTQKTLGTLLVKL